MAENDLIYRLTLPTTLPPVDVWLSTYGRKLVSDELYSLLHFKNQSIPKQQFIVWCDREVMGRQYAWILPDVLSVRTLWHTLGNRLANEGWYVIDKTLVLPFTDTPVF